MHMINYDKVFRLFVSKDDLRPALMHPSLQGDKYYATDCNVMIIAPRTLELGYKEVKDYPQCERVLPAANAEPIEFNINDLAAQLIPLKEKQFKTVYEKVNCGECDATGQIKGKLMNHKCCKCNGKRFYSVQSRKETGKMINDPACYFKLLDQYFYHNILKTMVDACKLMQVKTVTKLAGTGVRAALFQCGEVQILLMPMMPYAPDEAPEDGGKKVEINLK